MHYRFRADDSSIQKGLRRIALEQVDCALGAVDAALLRRWGAWWDLWERQGEAPKKLAA